jgi:cytochrome c556
VKARVAVVRMSRMGSSAHDANARSPIRRQAMPAKVARTSQVSLTS